MATCRRRSSGAIGRRQGGIFQEGPSRTTRLSSGFSRFARSRTVKAGFPWQHARADGGWEPDPWIWDDQGVVCHVKGRGLVVVSSCSHAGVINVLRNAAQATGVPKVHGFVGGLHLTGACSSRLSRGRSRRSRGSRRMSSCPGTARGGGRRTRSCGGCPGRTCRRAWGRRCDSGSDNQVPASA